MAANDTIDVFLMKAPVFEFRFGDLLGKFVSIYEHDGPLHLASHITPVLAAALLSQAHSY